MYVCMCVCVCVCVCACVRALGGDNANAAESADVLAGVSMVSALQVSKCVCVCLCVFVCVCAR